MIARHAYQTITQYKQSHYKIEANVEVNSFMQRLASSMIESV